jgi:hypothetical protein
MGWQVAGRTLRLMPFGRRSRLKQRRVKEPVFTGGPPTTICDEMERVAEAYRLRQAQKLLDVFEDANGHPARTLLELEQWAVSPQGKAALA